MIVPDVNLLIFAYNSDAVAHTAARQWWENLLSGDEPVAIPWVVLCGFVRLMTHPAVLVVPMEIPQAFIHVRSWLSRPNVQILEPGPRHLEILENTLQQAGVGGNLVTDAHIAALALEYQAQVHSNDADFGRFSGLRWHNPLSKR
ncbi:type II toxin-antitoxin system VapC family toxin [bacterium]|nr:type II toxin-antitoxin system VapC family toxin [bacterium]